MYQPKNRTVIESANVDSGMPKFDLSTMQGAIALLLVLILWKLVKIDARLKERFPTEKEEDYKWSQEDPMGHYEAHK